MNCLNQRIVKKYCVTKHRKFFSFVSRENLKNFIRSLVRWLTALVVDNDNVYEFTTFFRVSTMSISRRDIAWSCINMRRVDTSRNARKFLLNH